MKNYIEFNLLEWHNQKMKNYIEPPPPRNLILKDAFHPQWHFFVE